MKTREEILSKGDSLGSFGAGSTEEEARQILTDIAGSDEADMFSEAGIHDLLFSLDREEDETVQAASRLVREFLG
jgi:plasmid stability protein